MSEYKPKYKIDSVAIQKLNNFSRAKPKAWRWYKCKPLVAGMFIIAVYPAAVIIQWLFGDLIQLFAEVIMYQAYIK